MGKKIRSSSHQISDFPHKRSAIQLPYVAPVNKKNFLSPADFYYGQKGSDVTLFCHLPPPPHSQDPKIAKAPDPYFGKEGNDVTEWLRYVDMARPVSRDWYFGKPSSDVTEWLNQPVPAGPNPAGDSFWGRTKSYVTDPSCSPNQTPPARPLDGQGTMAAMSWNAKSKSDQIPLGKSVSKIQSMLNALERSQRKAPPTKPRGERVSMKGKRYSPGYPIGRSPKDFPPPGWNIPERKATQWESTYWGKCKSYVTDYAMSPTLTPPGRPLLGEQAKEAMQFAPETGNREEKIPLGRPVKRMGGGRPFSPTNQSPHHPTGLETKRKLQGRPFLTPHPNPPPGSRSPGSASPPSPKLPPPKAAPKSGQASPPSPAASSSGGSAKKGNQGNLRWRDQQKTGNVSCLSHSY